MNSPQPSREIIVRPKPTIWRTQSTVSVSLPLAIKVKIFTQAFVWQLVICGLIVTRLSYEIQQNSAPPYEWMAFLLMAAFPALTISKLLVRLVLRKCTLTLSDCGIVDERLGPQMIPWGQITDISLRRYESVRFGTKILFATIVFGSDSSFLSHRWLAAMWAMGFPLVKRNRARLDLSALIDGELAYATLQVLRAEKLPGSQSHDLYNRF